ncbi:MAG TPA: hypothetical protein VIG74_01875 [Alphaproteobacteria bacterium]|jgi:hypothetical protein
MGEIHRSLDVLGSVFSIKNDGYHNDMDIKQEMNEAVAAISRIFKDPAKFTVIEDAESTLDCHKAPAKHIIVVCNDFGMNR